jgi:glycosyltransferase involved in cell wall biosynthesis
MIKKILFISNEGSRTGAPLILLHLLKWLNKNTERIQFDVLLIKGGAIADDFRKECANTFVYSELYKPEKFIEIATKKFLEKFGLKQKQKALFFIENIASNNYDIIYSNTIVSIPIAVKIKKYCQNSKLIVHVHELNTIIKMALPDFYNYKNYIDKYLAVSHQVKENLVSNWEVNKNAIDVIFPFSLFKFDKANILKESEIFTVGASGTAHWPKGVDVFIQIANYVAKKYPQAKINFVWVGNNLTNKYLIEDDIEKLGLKEVVSFVGEQTNPIDFYRNFDVFLLTSREDSFPIVCIEAANLKKPIICFEKASGTAEVIEKGGGFVVPYLDIEAMGEKIIYYYNSPSKMNEEGLRAQELFADFTPEKICPLLYEQINSLIK